VHRVFNNVLSRIKLHMLFLAINHGAESCIICEYPFPKIAQIYVGFQSMFKHILTLHPWLQNVIISQLGYCDTYKDDNYQNYKLSLY